MSTSQAVVVLTALAHGVPVPKKDGGTYLATVLGYTGRDGQSKTKAIHSGILGQNAALTADLQAVKVGDTVSITSEKVGNFLNVVSVKKVDPATLPTETKPAFTGTKGGKSFVDNSVGMQVGNALTNATNLIAAFPKNHDIDDLEVIAEKILHIGERLKAKLVGGLSEPKAEAPKKAKEVEAHKAINEDPEEADIEF